MTDAPSVDADDLDPLTRLAIRHGTDKWGPHFYTPIYHALFSHLRDKAVRLLEIGIGGYRYRSVGGASLSMWAEYFPRGRIVGIDNMAKKLQLDARITTLSGAQDDADFLTRLCDEHGPFDIVIDDGSHVPRHVVASFRVLFPRLADGGLYVIEDVQTTFWPEYGGSPAGGATMRLVLTLLRDLNHAELAVVQSAQPASEWAKHVRAVRAYHNLIVVEKGDNDEPSNFDYRLDNPHAVRARRLIELELARAPTPEGYANLIDLLSYGGDFAAAGQRTAEALTRWPDHPALLASAADGALRAGEADAFAACMERLMRLEPGNARLRKFYAKGLAKLRSGLTATDPIT
jgi:Methyltransferase domain